MNIKKQFLFACGIAALMSFVSSCNMQKSNIILQTERLYFRPFVENDFERFYELHTDAEVMKKIPLEQAFGKKVDRVMLRELFDAWMRHQKELGFSFWAAFEKGTDEFVGRIGVVYDAPDELMAGYVMHKKFWGKGYASEAMKAILPWVFAHTKFKKIIAICEPENKASIHVMEKIGMHYVRTASKHGITCVQYEIERPKSLWQQFKNWVKGKRCLIFSKKHYS